MQNKMSDPARQKGKPAPKNQGNSQKMASSNALTSVSGGLAVLMIRERIAEGATLVIAGSETDTSKSKKE